MSISVIVAALNAARTLEEQLAALATQDDPSIEYEVLVCDNGSQDETRELVLRLSHELGRPPDLVVVNRVPRKPAPNELQRSKSIGKKNASTLSLRKTITANSSVPIKKHIPRNTMKRFASTVKLTEKKSTPKLENGDSKTWNITGKLVATLTNVMPRNAVNIRWNTTNVFLKNLLLRAIAVAL